MGLRPVQRVVEYQNDTELSKNSYNNKCHQKFHDDTFSDARSMLGAQFNM